MLHLLGTGSLFTAIYGAHHSNNLISFNSAQSFRQEKVVQIPFLWIWRPLCSKICISSLGSMGKHPLLWSSEFSLKSHQNLTNQGHLITALPVETPGKCSVQWEWHCDTFIFLQHRGLSALHLTPIPADFKCWKQISDHDCFDAFLSTPQNYGTHCFYGTEEGKLQFHLRETVKIYHPNITENAQNHFTGQLMNTLFLVAVLFLCRFEHVADL